MQARIISTFRRFHLILLTVKPYLGGEGRSRLCTPSASEVEITRRHSKIITQASLSCLVTPQMTVDWSDRRILEDVSSFNVQVSAVADAPPGRENLSWLDSTVRGGHDPEYTMGCSETGHLSLPFHSFTRHIYIYGGWLW